MDKKAETIRHIILYLCVIAFIAIGYDAQGSGKYSHAAEDNYISDIVFWDSGNARSTRDYGFASDDEGPYSVAIDDNARSLRVKVVAEEFQEEDVYCQMQIGDTTSEPVQMVSGETTTISAPVTMELQGNYFRLGERKNGRLIVGKYSAETGTWNANTKEFAFSFMRRVVMNSFAVYDKDDNKLVTAPAAIDPSIDEYTVSVPENAETVKFIPNLTIRDTVRDAEDPDGTKYCKTVTYHVPDGAMISGDEDAIFDIAALTDNNDKKYIDCTVAYSKEGSDVVSSDYRFYLDIYGVQQEIDHTPDAVIIESEQNVICNKNTEVEFKVSAQVEGEANLSYQWYSSQTKDGNFSSKVENETDCSYKPTTAFAHPASYFKCKVTNTVNGKRYSKFSDVFSLTVNLDYITPPEIYEISKDQELWVNSRAELEVRSTVRDQGVSVSYQWCVNDQRSTDGAREVTLKDGWEGPPYSHGYYDFNEPGEFYYFCIVTAAFEEKSASSTSDFIKITVKEPQGLDVFSGEGTVESPYIIDSLDELEKIKTVLQTGYFFKDKYFKLSTDLTLPSDWEPIGALKDGTNETDSGINICPFSGNLDGAGHTVTVSEGGKPLLGYVREASVSNLKIYGKKIAGYGLIDNYTVDYGTDGDSGSGVPNTCNITNVTILSGTSIQKAGFVGGYASGGNSVNIRNCTVQRGVTIGYDKSERSIGSFGGSFNGTISGCSSAADVYGTRNVGGLVGGKGQAMGAFRITGCKFTGSITATENRVGGIAGSGYGAESAPNTPVASINNCYVDAIISGAEDVGGIFGSEPGVETCWGNGTGGVQNSFFYGQILSSGSNVGGIIGYYNSLDKFQTISNNFYLSTSGATKGIGKLKKIITAAEDSQFGREDDFDADSACAPASAEAFADGTIVQKLNAGEMSLGNWKQGPNYPIFDEAAVPTDLQITNYREVYDTSETGIDMEGMQVTVLYSDGSSQSLDPSEVSFSGFDKQTIGRKTITAEYGAIKTTFRITILYKNPEPISVRLILLGDTIHPDSDKVHTLKDGGLQEWINEDVTINTNMTVKDALCIALEEKGLSQKGSFYEQYDSWYVSGIQIPGTEKYLEEFTNGANSGWMYTVNGRHPDVGVDRYYLEDGDEIIFHYTDEHTNEVEQMEGEYPYQKPDNPDEPVSIKDAKVVLSDASFTYNGKVQRPSIKTVGGKALKAGTDYTATWSNSSSKNAGTYTVTITGKGAYTGVTKATYKIARAGQKMTVKATKKTLKASKLKKKARTISAITVKKQGGAVKYRKLSGSSRLSVNSKTGKITVRKKTKKGTYKIKVKVTSAANTNYKAAARNIIVKVVVK